MFFKDYLLIKNVYPSNPNRGFLCKRINNIYVSKPSRQSTFILECEVPVPTNPITPAVSLYVATPDTGRVLGFYVDSYMYH